MTQIRGATSGPVTSRFCLLAVNIGLCSPRFFDLFQILWTFGNIYSCDGLLSCERSNSDTKSFLNRISNIGTGYGSFKFIVAFEIHV